MEPREEALDALQRRLAARVQIPTDDTAPGAFVPRPGCVVLSLDIQYDDPHAHVAGDLHLLGGEHLGTWAGLARVDFPYVPGHFCFREGPPLLALVERLRAEGLPTPDVMVIDGHGIAHPRRFGVACWMGLACDTPSVGCAKEPLLRFKARPTPERGAWNPVHLGDELVGAIMCTQDGVKPVFVSPGLHISLEASKALVLALGGEYRVPDPIRRADQAARARARGEEPQGWIDLGELAPASPPWRQAPPCDAPVE